MPEIIAPRQQKARKTKQKIFDAAAKLLAEYGEEYLTIKNICAEAGISNGSFFYHFKSKEDLMFYYVKEGYDVYVSEHPHINKVDPRDFVRAIVDIYLYYAEYCLSTGVVFVSSLYTPSNKALGNTNVPGATESMSSMFRDSLMLYRSAQHEGLASSEYAPEVVAEDTCCIVKGCIFEWCLNDGDMDLLKSVERLLTLYLANMVTGAYRSEFGSAQRKAEDLG